MTGIRARKTGNGAARRAQTAKKRIYHPGPPIADEAGLLEATERLRAKDPELVDRLRGRHFWSIASAHRPARGGGDREGDGGGLARLRIVERQNPDFAG